MILALSLLLSTAFAKTNCEVSAFEYKSLHKMPEEGYWMQAAGERYITYTSTGGTSSKLYDLKTGQNVPMTERIDGFGLPEGDLYIHPSDGPEIKLAFYKIDDAVKKGNEAQPIFEDAQHTGYYQSVAVTKKNGNTRMVRVLTAQGEGKIQDYKITKKNNGSYTFKKQLTTPKAICKNLNRENLDFQIPILSRDGTKFATKDYNTGTTKLYSISMPSGACKEEADLGVETDKVSFSFDNNQIAYSTTIRSMLKDSSGQSYETWIKVLHIYDIKKKTSKIVSSPGENVLYHGYRPDGQLMYTRSAADGGYESELIMIDPESVEGSQATEKAAAEIGHAWAKDCDKEFSPEEAMAAGFRLKKAECTSVVEGKSVTETAKSFCNAKSGSQNPVNSGTK